MPLLIFFVVLALLYVGLGLNPRDVPSVLINKKAPEISLPDLFDPEKRVNSSSMQGKVWLLNVWGTWCPECWREHPYLNHLAQEEGVPIVGIAWRDDRDAAKQMLARKGNPFIMVGFDADSRAVMDFGVYGAPETFLIDKKGFIRWKYTGSLNAEVWSDQLQPLYLKLQGEP
jgi:cytochrome c biogenesis protein CcmG/thiol:disulfide interchange protein DsbE